VHVLSWKTPQHTTKERPRLIPPAALNVKGISLPLTLALFFIMEVHIISARDFWHGLYSMKEWVEVVKFDGGTFGGKILILKLIIYLA